MQGDTPQRVFLFLQGPASRFFGTLGAALAGRGHGVRRINFHGGDQAFWPLPGSISYRGADRDWPAFVEATIVEEGVTDIILFGDCRPRHRAAVKVAEQLEVGMANVNTPAGEGADLPFGGTKRSGFGRELGPLGIDEFVNKRLFYVEK